VTSGRLFEGLQTPASVPRQARIFQRETRSSRRFSATSSQWFSPETD